jgi:hypothetical protein
MAGYSGTPLATKLGIKAGQRIAVLGAPAGFEVPDLPDDVQVAHDLLGRLDLALSFHVERTDLEADLPLLMAALVVDASLWVAWPKKASKVPTEITEDIVREIALPTGLVDNKVCAIDQTWSGLRLVLRKELRPTRQSLAP